MVKKYAIWLMLAQVSGCVYWIGEPLRQEELKGNTALIHRSDAMVLVASALLNVQQRCLNFQDSSMRWQLAYFYMTRNACRYDPEGGENWLTGCADEDYLSRSELNSCLGAIVADSCGTDATINGQPLPSGDRLAAFGICARAFKARNAYPVYSAY